jgi:multidrug efflux pump subunit AcrB
MVTLGQVADVDVTRGAEKINREQGQRRIVVMSNVRGRDLGSFVAEVQQKVNNNVKLPAGYPSLMAVNLRTSNAQRVDSCWWSRWRSQSYAASSI